MGNDALTVLNGDYSVNVQAASASITSPQKITLSVAGSSIEISPEGVTIAAPVITLQAEGSAKITGQMVQVGGGGMVQIEGGVVTIN